MTVSPDALLLGYAEALTLLGSARAQRFTLTFGSILAKTCERTKNCTGMPRKDAEGWKCSACRKPWTSEPAELGRNEEGERSAQRWRESHLHARLIDAAWIFRQVEYEMPWAFTAWCVHLLHPVPNEMDPRATPRIGIPQDEVAACLLELARKQFKGTVYRVPVLLRLPWPVSLYRVKSWIRQARDRTRTVAMMRGV